MSETQTVGITGGIGSGKSAVGQMLARRGYTVIDADRISRDLTGPGSPLIREIAGALGPDVVAPDGSLDRKRAASVVFGDSHRRKALETILHPRIVDEYRKLAGGSGGAYVFILVPLLFEAHLEDTVDIVWLCYSPREIRITRTIERDKMTREEVIRRMNAQMPDEEKLDRVDVVVDTSGSMDDTERHVERALQEMGEGTS